MKKLLSIASAFVLALSMSASAVDLAAPCNLAMMHFDVSPGWFTGLVILNMSQTTQDVTVAAIGNEPFPEGGDPMNPVIGNEFTVTMTFGQKMAWLLKETNPNQVPSIFGTGLKTGSLLAQSEQPLLGFVLFGRNGGKDSLAALGPFESVCEPPPAQ